MLVPVFKSIFHFAHFNIGEDKRENSEIITIMIIWYDKLEDTWRQSTSLIMEVSHNNFEAITVLYSKKYCHRDSINFKIDITYFGSQPSTKCIVRDLLPIWYLFLKWFWWWTFLYLKNKKYYGFPEFTDLRQSRCNFRFQDFASIHWFKKKSTESIIFSWILIHRNLFLWWCECFLRF